MRKSVLSRLLAKSQAALHRHPQQRYSHWTYFIVDNVLVGSGVNRSHEPPLFLGYHRLKDGNFRPKWHAESDAIVRARKAKKKPRKMVAVNVRLNRHGEMRTAKPCSVCREHLRRFGCSRVYYTTNNGWATEQLC